MNKGSGPAVFAWIEHAKIQAFHNRIPAPQESLLIHNTVFQTKARHSQSEKMPLLPLKLEYFCSYKDKKSTTQKFWAFNAHIVPTPKSEKAKILSCLRHLDTALQNFVPYSYLWFYLMQQKLALLIKVRIIRQISTHLALVQTWMCHSTHTSTCIKLKQAVGLQITKYFSWSQKLFSSLAFICWAPKILCIACSHP